MYYSWPDFPPIIRENIQHTAERNLQAIWNYLFLKVEELKTTDGTPLKILDQGSWNLDEAGPDFLSATLRIGEEVLTGDVEVHWKTSDWQSHGHQTDPRYKRVILHAVFDHEPETSNPPCATLELKNYLTDSLQKLAQKIRSLDRFRENIFCYEEIPGLEPAWIDSWVMENGRRRLEYKKEQLTIEQEREKLTLDDLLYRNIMDALGYSKNREPFRRLAKIIPYEPLMESVRSDSPETALMRIQAILLGASGLLAAETKTDLVSVPFLQRLESLWSEYPHRKTSMKMREWKLFRMRPANFPTMRMAGWAKFLVRIREERLFDVFWNVFQNSGEVHATFNRLQKMLTVEAFGYWSTHYRWGDEGKHGHRDLIGGQRASEIIVNVVLPSVFLNAERMGREDIKIKIHSLYASVPSKEKNSSISYMQRQLTRDRQKNLNMQYAQGLIHLHKRCREYDCAQCTIFERISDGRT